MGSAWWIPNALPTAHADPKSVYELESIARGEVVVVVAPGPSLASFPKEKLQGKITIGVNAVPELLETEYWIFQEKTFCRMYHPLYSTGKIRRVVTTWKRSFLGRMMPEGSELYCFNYQQIYLHSYRKKCPVFWYDKNLSYLPGHASISSNAMSLAVLMEPKTLLLVGIDFSMSQGDYYADGVKLNRGPKIHNRQRALESGREWMTNAAQRGVWSGPRIITTSPTLSIPQFEHVSIDQAVAELES